METRNGGGGIEERLAEVKRLVTEKRREGVLVGERERLPGGLRLEETIVVPTSGRAVISPQVGKVVRDRIDVILAREKPKVGSFHGPVCGLGKEDGFEIRSRRAEEHDSSGRMKDIEDKSLDSGGGGDGAAFFSASREPEARMSDRESGSGFQEQTPGIVLPRGSSGGVTTGGRLSLGEREEFVVAPHTFVEPERTEEGGDRQGNGTLPSDEGGSEEEINQKVEKTNSVGRVESVIETKTMGTLFRKRREGDQQKDQQQKEVSSGEGEKRGQRQRAENIRSLAKKEKESVEGTKVTGSVWRADTDGRRSSSPRDKLSDSSPLSEEKLRLGERVRFAPYVRYDAQEVKDEEDALSKKTIEEGGESPAGKEEKGSLSVSERKYSPAPLLAEKTDDAKSSGDQSQKDDRERAVFGGEESREQWIRSDHQEWSENITTKKKEPTGRGEHVRLAPKNGDKTAKHSAGAGGEPSVKGESPPAVKKKSRPDSGSAPEGGKAFQGEEMVDVVLEKEKCKSPKGLEDILPALRAMFYYALGRGLLTKPLITEIQRYLLHGGHFVQLLKIYRLFGETVAPVEPQTLLSVARTKRRGHKERRRFQILIGDGAGPSDDLFSSLLRGPVLRFAWFRATALLPMVLILLFSAACVVLLVIPSWAHFSYSGDKIYALDALGVGVGAAFGGALCGVLRLQYAFLHHRYNFQLSTRVWVNFFFVLAVGLVAGMLYMLYRLPQRVMPLEMWCIGASVGVLSWVLVMVLLSLVRRKHFHGGRFYMASGS